ncbi:hypothetical protein OF83DRAFT_1169070 [Amylostereum chailletii]|nr:hypothetical protein OF83DRAFT_1169070 [Amylostereum chailletii]
MVDTTSQTQTRTTGNAPRGRRTNRRGPRGGGAVANPRANGPPLQAQPVAVKPSEGKQETGKEFANVVEATDAEDDDRVCWICAEQVKYFSVSECNHRTCHVCALRLRALYKKLDCTFCKEPQPTVIFTVSADTPFSSYSPDDIPYKDAKLSIHFETQEMMDDSLVLLRFNCPDTSCEYIATGWNDLKLHARGVHGKMMCDLCLRHKKVFSHEHALYPPHLLSIHLPSMPHRGSQKPVPKEQIEGGIHPMCDFDRECFFGDDELYAHMRERHEECFVCKRNEVRDQHFKNYEALERHFNNEHYPCMNPICQTRKFVVFGSHLDLQAHMVEEHGAEMSTRQQKDARRVNAGFEFQEANQGGRRRGGREREREREPPPGSGAGSSSEPPGDAASRSINSRRNRFGAHLTVDDDTSGSANPSPAPSRRQSPSPPPADMDPVTAARYSDLFARLKAVAPNPTNAVAAVKLSLRSYSASESGARDLLSTVWNILDRDLDDTANIVNLMVDVLDDEEKKSLLLGAWNGFKIEQRRQFPDLVPTSIGTNYAGITGGRMLAKSSPARSSRQPSSAVWDRVAQAASGSSNASTSRPSPAPRFPPLQPSAPNPPVTSGYRQPVRNTAWSSSGSGSGPAPAPVPRPHSVNTPSVPTRERAPPPKLSNSLFPELPSSSQSKKPVVTANGSLQKILGSSAPATSAWGAQGQAADGSGLGEGASGQASAQNGGGGKKKGKGKQKQTLFTLGAFPT